MVKHGGGYVILDLRDAELNDREAPTGFVNLNEQQVNAIKTAVDEKLPVMYIGRGATTEGMLSDNVSAAFTYAMNNGNDYALSVPNTSTDIGFTGAMLQGTSLTLYTV